MDVFQAGLALDDESELEERRNDYINNNNNNNNNDENDDENDNSKVYGSIKSKVYGNIESRSMVIGDNTNYKKESNEK